MLSLRPSWALAAGVSAAIGMLAQTPSPRVDFARDVQPILTASCQGCHGPKAQMGQLRLDAKASAARTFKAGKSAEVALKDFRKGAAKSTEALKKADAPLAVRLAAVDDVRERLVDEPNSPLTGEVAALLGSTDVEVAKLLLAALAEAKAAGATSQVAALAAKTDSPLRVPAALALAEVGGAKAVPVLAGLASDAALADSIQEALLKVAGPGVTDAFVAGITDTKSAPAARAALIKAAVARNLRSVAGALCVAPEMLIPPTGRPIRSRIGTPTQNTPITSSWLSIE